MVATSVSLALATGASAQGASTVTPPPGTPDLSQMVLQPSDFSHAGAVVREGYISPSSPAVVASYNRIFGASTVGDTHFSAVDSAVRLITNVDTATQLFQVTRLLLHVRQGREAFLRAFIQGFNRGAGSRVLRFADFHFLRMHRLGIGDASFILPSTFVVHGIPFSVDIVGVRVDRTIGALELAGIGRIHRADAVQLARDIATNMESVSTSSPG